MIHFFRDTLSKNLSYQNSFAPIINSSTDNQLRKYYLSTDFKKPIILSQNFLLLLFDIIDLFL